jgi:hypothetical protein
MIIVIYISEMPRLEEPSECLIRLFESEKHALEFINQQTAPIEWHMFKKVPLVEKRQLNRWYGLEETVVRINE